MYSTADLRFVLNQLDLDFEHKIGYNYDYVKGMLDKENSFADKLENLFHQA